MRALDVSPARLTSTMAMESVLGSQDLAAAVVAAANDIHSHLFQHGLQSLGDLPGILHYKHTSARTDLSVHVLFPGR